MQFICYKTVFFQVVLILVELCTACEVFMLCNCRTPKKWVRCIEKSTQSTHGLGFEVTKKEFGSVTMNMAWHGFCLGEIVDLGSDTITVEVDGAKGKVWNIALQFILHSFTGRVVCLKFWEKSFKGYTWLRFFIYLNNIYYNICSKSKVSSSRRLMLFTMHITRDGRTKHTQRNRSYQKRLDNCLQLTRKVTNKPVQQIPFNSNAS